MTGGWGGIEKPDQGLATTHSSISSVLEGTHLGYTKLSVGEKVRMQFDTMVTDTKRSVLGVSNVGVKPK